MMYSLLYQLRSVYNICNEEMPSKRVQNLNWTSFLPNPNPSRRQWYMYSIWKGNMNYIEYKMSYCWFTCVYRDHPVSIGNHPQAINQPLTLHANLWYGKQDCLISLLTWLESFSFSSVLVPSKVCRTLKNTV